MAGPTDTALPLRYLAIGQGEQPPPGKAFAHDARTHDGGNP
jgi:hypothetical protein